MFFRGFLQLNGRDAWIVIPPANKTADVNMLIYLVNGVSGAICYKNQVLPNSCGSEVMYKDAYIALKTWDFAHMGNQMLLKSRYTRGNEANATLDQYGLVKIKEAQGVFGCLQQRRATSAGPKSQGERARAQP